MMRNFQHDGYCHDFEEVIIADETHIHYSNANIDPGLTLYLQGRYDMKKSIKLKSQ
jgi:hypothetical protein